jgi:hypothetical protein
MPPVLPIANRAKLLGDVQYRELNSLDYGEDEKDGRLLKPVIDTGLYYPALLRAIRARKPDKYNEITLLLYRRWRRLLKTALSTSASNALETLLVSIILMKVSGLCAYRGHVRHYK